MEDDSMKKGIIEKYSHEIGEINNMLTQLKSGIFYDPANGKFDKGAGSLTTNIEKLEVKFNELLNKIEKDKKSVLDDIGEFFSTLE